MVAVSRVVQARARLRERRKQQQVALVAVLRCADGVEAARARQRELVKHGSRLVADAEGAQAGAVVVLAHAMGSVELAAAVLDVDVAVVRKAVAADAATRRTASRAKPTAAPSVSPPGATRSATS